jgi:hypothetical protein
MIEGGLEVEKCFEGERFEFLSYGLRSFNYEGII